MYVLNRHAAVKKFSVSKSIVHTDKTIWKTSSGGSNEAQEQQMNMIF